MQRRESLGDPNCGHRLYPTPGVRGLRCKFLVVLGAVVALVEESGGRIPGETLELRDNRFQ